MKGLLLRMERGPDFFWLAILSAKPGATMGSKAISPYHCPLAKDAPAMVSPTIARSTGMETLLGRAAASYAASWPCFVEKSARPRPEKLNPDRIRTAALP